jgi:hypothetical protein
MTRLRRGLPVAFAVLGVAAFAAAPAGATTKRHAAHGHAGYAHARPAPRHVTNFPVYVDRGTDYNPGSDNLYFSDTKTPHYIVGPAWFQRWD